MEQGNRGVMGKSPCGPQRSNTPLLQHSVFRSPVAVIVFPSRPRGAALKERFKANYWFAICRALRHLERCLTIQSVKARSKPMSCPAFSDSIHLCLRISSRSAVNSRYKDDRFTKSVPFLPSDELDISKRFFSKFIYRITNAFFGSNGNGDLPHNCFRANPMPFTQNASAEPALPP